MGVRIKRREDPALITGQGKYTGDIVLDNMAVMMVLRSPYGHATIDSIDTSAAAAMPGVLAVITAADVNDQLAEPLPMTIGADESYPVFHSIARYPLAAGKVRHVGDPVAVVVAEDKYTAADALEAIAVSYTPLPTVVDPEQAMTDGAPQLHDHIPNNIAFRWQGGNDVSAAFAAAEKVIEVRIHNQRLLPTAMEPRAVTASYDAAADRYTIWTSTQIPHSIKEEVAQVLGIDQEKIRAIAPEVGGGFGAKSNVFPEEVLAPFLAKKVGRPIKWVATRSEDLQSTSHGRDQINIVRVAATNDGKVQAVDLKVIADCGSYYSRVTPGIPPLTGMMMTGVYEIPNARTEAVGVLTNKGINEPYRGAGRPEAAFMIERAMDALADELDIDPIEIRRRNFIAPDKFPYTTPTGATYDSGEYEKSLNRALELVDIPALRAEQAARRANGGKLLGIGLASYVEICGFGPWEAGTVIINGDATATVLTGTSPHGQGHETAWAQIAANTLQLPIENITVKHGDTAVVPRGIGTFGSRSAPVGGSAVMRNSESVREKAKAIAAHLLEAAVEDMTLENGQFSVAGSPQAAVTWTEVAAAAYSDSLPEELKAQLPDGLQSDEDFSPPGETYPFGTHVSVIEIDPDNGRIEIVRYVTVDDCGPAINPLLIEGQVHGGIAQGVGQALLERALYDEGGQLVSGSFMDYNVPRADNFPIYETHRTETPTPLNPLGVKGIGEAATIGSTPCIANAVIDALSHLGIRQLDMPFTPEKVWRAIHGN
jgi:carbon-monoxide dehydrogenase large subunit